MKSRTPVPRLRGCAASLVVATLLGGALTPAQAQSVSEVDVSPPQLSLKVGQSATLFAVAYDRQGNLVTTKFSWLVSDTTLATVSPDGRVTAKGPGTATVAVGAGGKTATVSVLI